MKAYKFSDTATPDPPDILQGRTEMDFLKSKYDKGCIFGLDHLQKMGSYKLMGWCFNFTPFMNKYLVKQNGYWEEYFAPNNSMLRKSIYGKIQKIVKIN
jgi:hypothetical protein